MRTLAVSIATCGPFGYAPIAPGTAGSFAALGLFWAVRTWGGPGLELAVLVVVTAVGIWAASEGERQFGKTDPRTVVVDEVAGMLVTLLWLPVGWFGMAVGFFAFRLFDIVKPFPARSAERLHGGLGIMADDLIAGLYAHLTVRLLAWAMPGLMMAS